MHPISSRLKIVGVMGSGTRPYRHLARPLGELIAAGGYHLLTGGGGGVMAEVSRAFCDVRPRQGLAIGIVRSLASPHLDERTGQRSYTPNPVNEWVELPIFTHLPTSDEAFSSRNHLNVLTADALVALPGGSGTLSEVRLRLQYGRPVILYLGPPRCGATVAGKSATELAAQASRPKDVLAAETPDEVRRQIERCLRGTS